MKDRTMINQAEQKQIMLEMLRYVDGVCREHDIKYSLIGGSLIGAIRHRGYIPWDDDIDIILAKKNYDRLKKILDVGDGIYKTLQSGKGGERFSFLKLVDTRTVAKEYAQKEIDSNYGVYIDIFCYYPAPNDARRRRSLYRKLKILRSLLIRHRLDFGKMSFRQNVRWMIKNSMSYVLGYKTINKMFDGALGKYAEADTDYVMSSWLTYGFEHEIQLKKNTEDYIDAEFEGLKVMIFKNYDEILRTTFGDYMQLPPESERVPKHNMTMWWREGYEEEAEKLRAEIEKCKNSDIGNTKESKGRKQKRAK